MKKFLIVFLSAILFTVPFAAFADDATNASSGQAMTTDQQANNAGNTSKSTTTTKKKKKNCGCGCKNHNTSTSEQ